MSLSIPADAHPGVRHYEFLFEFEHLPAGDVRDTSAACAELAQTMVNALGNGPEQTAGLRKLVEAKDCFVRQAILDARAERARQANADGAAGTDKPQVDF